MTANVVVLVLMVVSMMIAAARHQSTSATVASVVGIVCGILFLASCENYDDAAVHYHGHGVCHAHRDTAHHYEDDMWKVTDGTCEP